MPARLLVVLALLLGLTGCQDAPPEPTPSLRLVYRVTAQDGTVTTEVVDLSPPYRARTTQHAGDGLATPVTGMQVWDGTGTYQSRDDQVLQNEYVAPGFPGPAAALDVALPVAERQALVRSLGPGEAAGRACARWESRRPLDGAPFSAATPRERTVSCVDAQGRLLADEWSSGGRLLRRRQLVFLGDGPSLAGVSLFGGRTPVPLPTQASTVIVRPASPDELVRLLQVPGPAQPEGLRLDRSVALIHLTADRQRFRRESAVLTYTSDQALLVLQVSRDLEAGGAPAVRGTAVPLGPGRTGRLEPVLAGLRLVLDGPHGLRATVTTDLPETALLTWARGLRLG